MNIPIIRAILAFSILCSGVFYSFFHFMTWNFLFLHIILLACMIIVYVIHPDEEELAEATKEYRHIFDFIKIGAIAGFCSSILMLGLGWVFDSTIFKNIAFILFLFSGLCGVAGNIHKPEHLESSGGSKLPE